MLVPLTILPEAQPYGKLTNNLLHGADSRVCTEIQVGQTCSPEAHLVFFQSLTEVIIILATFIQSLYYLDGYT